MGNLLDVGSAVGFILKGFEREGWNCQGIEPNDSVTLFGREVMGLKIYTGSLETFKKDMKFDLITLIQVIGQFYNLDKAILNVSKLLKPGGYVLVESWDMNSLIAKAFGKSWHEYSPPSVLHWYSDKTLQELFKYYGFILEDKGRPVKKITMTNGLAIISKNSILIKKIISFLDSSIGNKTVPYPPLVV